jgi:hypothetical protein
MFDEGTQHEMFACLRDFRVHFLSYFLGRDSLNLKVDILPARDKIYTGVRREPDDGKLSSAVDGPDICRQRARRLPSTCQTDKITKSSPTSAVDRPDICRQRARQTKFSKVARHLPSTGPTSAVDRPDRQNSQR